MPPCNMLATLMYLGSLWARLESVRRVLISIDLFQAHGASLASYLPLIRHIRALLTRHKKKSYTISVGKLNPSKLANFLEIECFVLVACPENSVIEAKVRF